MGSTIPARPIPARQVPAATGSPQAQKAPVPRAAVAGVRPVSAPVVAPVAARPTSVAAGVSKAVGVNIRVPKSVVLGNTNDLGEKWFRACLYSETDGRKTTTAAQFATPEETRIVLTRRKEQLSPLEDLTKAGYQFAEVTDEEGLVVCLTHPEAVWTDPTWVNNPNRTLIFDDATEGVNILLAGNEVIDGKAVRNRMRTYDAAGKTLRDIVRVGFRAPQNIIMTALANVKENPITNVERVAPALPPSMQALLLTELEYVFYIKKGLWRLFTSSKYETVSKMIDGREEEFKREIFAKSKMPFIYKDAGIFGIDEPLDLRVLWEKVKNAKAIAAKKGIVGRQK